MVNVPPEFCTVIEIVVESVPPVFVAAIVYEASDDGAVGVPDISQVFDSNNPFGKAGEALQETIAPPVFVTGRGIIAAFATIVIPFSLYEITGGLSMTEKLILNESEPAELLAQTVWVDKVSKAVGVPQKVPLTEPKLTPVGNDCGSISQVVTSPPVLVA